MKSSMEYVSESYFQIIKEVSLNLVSVLLKKLIKKIKPLLLFPETYPSSVAVFVSAWTPDIFHMSLVFEFVAEFINSVQNLEFPRYFCHELQQDDLLCNRTLYFFKTLVGSPTCFG